ncbi:MAG: dual specificity protein phosphatase family protein [Candidatus Obscuribacterales bacterium]|nr:dual specificity protein phosphatase family protein [Candidatus Obscuribacterales bacterium]
MHIRHKSKFVVLLWILFATAITAAIATSAEHLALDQYYKSRAIIAIPERREICNFDTVEPYLLRGSRPTPHGMQWLKEHGIMTIVDLREQDTQPVIYEGEVARDMGFNYINLSVRNCPSLAQLRTFVEVVSKARAGAGKVFVHCNYGADRTGFFVFVWRMVGENWRASMAFEEMIEHGFLVHKLWREDKTSELSNPANW